MRQLAFAFVLLFAPFAFAQISAPSLAFEGYVTRAVSPLDFDVNGLRVLSNSKTKFSSEATHERGGPEASGSLYLGQFVSIYGKVSKHKHKIDATEIMFHSQVQSDLVGFAVIDRILSPLKSGEILVRADGYPIRIIPTTKFKLKSPLSSLSSVTPNVWITYHGFLHTDGIVVADSVVLSPNLISNREDKLLEKTDYDPAAVPDSTGQDPLRKLVFGVDPKKIPPYHDAAMQARIERVGKSLIPEYQRVLPISDETKILFQFQLVDGPEWRNPWALPSGVILVPRQIVELMQNDSQLAAILADGVSCALEKQTYREQPSEKTKAISELGSLAAGWGVFAAVTLSKYGYAGNIYGGNAPVERQNEDQRGRVALGLLRDGGYDLNDAPRAWWIISAKGASHLADSTMPDRAVNLFRTLGSIWNKNADTAAPSTATLGSK